MADLTAVSEGIKKAKVLAFSPEKRGEAIELLEGLLPGLAGGAPLLSETIHVAAGEGDIAGPLTDLAETYPDLSVGSYPFQADGRFQVNVVLRSPDAARLAEARAALVAALPKVTQ